MKLQAFHKDGHKPEIRNDNWWRTAARFETYVVAAMWLATMALLTAVAFTITQPGIVVPGLVR